MIEALGLVRVDDEWDGWLIAIEPGHAVVIEGKDAPRPGAAHRLEWERLVCDLEDLIHRHPADEHEH